MSVCYYFLNFLLDYKGGNDAFVFSHAVYHVSKMTLLWLAISSTLINQF